MFRFVVLAALFLSGVFVAAQENTVRLQIGWLPQSQFAGILVAEQKGFFAKYIPNRKIEVSWSQVTESPLDKLHGDTEDFCLAWLPDALLHRCIQGKEKNVCLMQVFQNTPLMLVTRTNSGIKKPSDLDGKQVQVWRGDLGFMMRTFFKTQNIKPVPVPQNDSMQPFIYGAVPVASALYFNEYHTLLERGIPETELRTFRLSDYGLDFPGDGIYCKAELWKSDSKLCKGVIQAVRDGWSFAAAPENEMETLAVVMKYVRKADVITNVSHQRWMLRTIRSDLHVDSADWGQLKQADFDRIAAVIKKSGELEPEQAEKIPVFNDFFTGQH
ncbi:MAG: ABC transporter substrate-binding protein [Planctomycetaceae bacterium]|jgi:NitT/TauT family transport system substrate-binding protein|nr:ABC transporter substrate-binding protein [Planctomycetaceae bacterium]